MLIYDFELEHKEPGQYNYDMVKIMDKNKCVYQFENGENSLSLDVVQRNPWVANLKNPRTSLSRRRGWELVKYRALTMSPWIR